MNENDVLWVDKYRPTKLDDYILNPDLKAYFKNMVTKKSLQNFSLAGIAGMGKTTLAKVMANEFNAETLFVKCATDGTVDILRTKIAEFCNAMTIDGRMKLVILDEVDSSSSTGQNNFQMALRTLIEAAQSDTRFILTCNFSTKVLPAILSRCPLIPLKFDKRDLLQHVKKILDLEHITYTKESLKAFIEEAFHFYPDCRRIIGYLQFCSSSGELIVKLNQVVDSDKTELLKDIVEKTQTSRSMLEVRQFYMRNKEKVSDYVAFGSDLYNYLADNDLLTVDGMVKMTDLLFQLNTVIDKEAGFYGMVVAMRKYLRDGEV